MKQASKSITNLNARIPEDLHERTAINATRGKTTIQAITVRGLELANAAIEQELEQAATTTEMEAKAS